MPGCLQSGERGPAQPSPARVFALPCRPWPSASWAVHTRKGGPRLRVVSSRGQLGRLSTPRFQVTFEKEKNTPWLSTMLSCKGGPPCTGLGLGTRLCFPLMLLSTPNVPAAPLGSKNSKKRKTPMLSGWHELFVLLSLCYCFSAEERQRLGTRYPDS